MVHRIDRHRQFRKLGLVLLLLSIAIAAALRSTGLGFGRGVLTARADEELLRSGVLISLTGDLNPHYAVWGHLFHYLYLAAAAVWLGIQLAFNQHSSWTHAVAALHGEPDQLIWLGRAISALAGTLTLLATYRLARRSLGGRVGPICALILLSTLFLHVRDSHFATCDILLALFCTAALASIAAPGNLRWAQAGLWTGLALATKLLAATVVLSCIAAVLLETPWSPAKSAWKVRLKQLAGFGFVASFTALLLQPFLLLDPMETWYGLFGDLFNPERRPFSGGLHLRNGAILAHYYIPQAMGWGLGGSALVGGVHLLSRARARGAGVVVCYALWSLLAFVSVERIFLRYLDPLLPAACVLSAHGIQWAFGRLRGWARGGVRLAFMLASTSLLATPNLVRSVWLDLRLCATDTRALAGRWIKQNVPSGSRILWSGYERIAPHLTMPWLHTPPAYDQEHVSLRAERGLPTQVDEAIRHWKTARSVPTYWLVGFAIGADRPERPGTEAYPMEDPHYDSSLLRRIDAWSRSIGLLRRESPRWELMRRHVTALAEWTPESLIATQESYVVITGMPCDPELVEWLSRRYDEVQIFDPLLPDASWSDYGKRMMYDMGDAWYVPNQGIHLVARPGPQIRIFARRQGMDVD